MLNIIFKILVAYFTTAQVLAVTATPSATPAASGSSQTTQNLRDRIERIVDEKRDQIEGILDDTNTKKLAIVGKVQRVSQETLTVTNSRGTQIISVGPQVFIRKKDAKVEIEDMVIGDWVTVMGLIDDQDTFQPTRIELATTQLQISNPVTVLGTIKEVSKTQITIKPRDNSSDIKINFDKNTSYQDLNGLDLQTPKLLADQQVLVAAFSKDEIVTAKLIRVLTGDKK